MVRVLGRTGDLFGGWGDVVMETGPGLGWAGAGRGMKGGLTWALVGAPLSGCLALALTPLLLSRWRRSGSRLCCYLWGLDGGGVGGRSTSSHLHRQVGREKGAGPLLGREPWSQGRRGRAEGGSEAGPPEQ